MVSGKVAVFVEIEGAHSGKIDPIVFMSFDEVLVDPDRSRASGESQDQLGPALEGAEDLLSDDPGAFFWIFTDNDLHDGFSHLPAY